MAFNWTVGINILQGIWGKEGQNGPPAKFCHLEAVDEQQVEFRMIFFVQKVLCQALQVGVDVSLHLGKTGKNHLNERDSGVSLPHFPHALSGFTPSPVLQQQFGQHRSHDWTVVHTLREGSEVSGPVHVSCIT